MPRPREVTDEVLADYLAWLRNGAGTRLAARLAGYHFNCFIPSRHGPAYAMAVTLAIKRGRIVKRLRATD